MTTSNNSELGPESFTTEKSLWDIYKKARKIKTSRFNLWSTILVFTFSTITITLSPHDATSLAEVVRGLAEFGFNSSTTILGFLVAGFTIFATVSNPNMLIEMGSLEHPDSGLSWMKHSFFVLLRTFIYFISFATTCFIVTHFATPNGPITFLIKMTPHPGEYALCLAKAGFVVISVGQFFLLMQLKSFVYNIYSAVAANLRWRAEGNY